VGSYGLDAYLAQEAE